MIIIDARKMSVKAKYPRVTRSTTCLCKAVEISVTGEDRGAALCHCSNCRRASGSAFAHNHRFSNARLTFARGAETLKEYIDRDTKSGKALLRQFCGICGSPLYLRSQETETTFVLNCGTMVGETSQPFKELFEHDRPSWLGQVTPPRPKL